MKRAIVARLIGDTNQKSKDLRYNVIDGLWYDNNKWVRTHAIHRMH